MVTLTYLFVNELAKVESVKKSAGFCWDIGKRDADRLAEYESALVEFDAMMGV